MKRIRRSNRPTPQQMLNMAFNLRAKFKEHAAVTTDCNAYVSKTSEIGYTMYVSKTLAIRYTMYIGNDLYHETFTTWHACQDEYFRIMKVGLP